METEYENKVPKWIVAQNGGGEEGQKDLGWRWRLVICLV